MLFVQILLINGEYKQKRRKEKALYIWHGMGKTLSDNINPGGA